MNDKKRTVIAVATALIVSGIQPAVSQEEPPINIGVILDARYQDGIRELSEFDDGFSLGHTELTLFGNIDETFRGVLTTVLEVADDETEVELEEAFIEAVGIGSGLNMRAGRFFSEFGYLNSRHLHEDDFSDRPAVYRSYLGDHYFDTGIATDFIVPAEQFISITLEAFDGEDLAAADTPDSEFGTINVWGGSVSFGADSSDSSSWQVGLSMLQNDNGSISTANLLAHEEGEEHDDSEDEEHGHSEEEEGHGHDHGPEVTGETMYGVDFTWKWAPDGNYKNKNLTLSAEYIKLDDLFDSIVGTTPGAPDSLNGWYLSAAYQFSPRWTLGVRYGEVEMYHGDVHFDDGEIEGEYEVEKIKETDISLAWHPSHYSTIRATYTREELRGPDENEDENIFVLQYVMSLGAHRAHSF